MEGTILVTGPELDPKAAEYARRHGFELVYAPPYADGAVLADLLVRSRAVALLVRMGRIDAGLIGASPRLRVISRHGAGVDNVDLEAAAAHGIPVLVAAGANAVSVAEHTIALLLAVVKRLLPLDRGMRDGLWEKPRFLGRELAGMQLGLVGFGAIARATARMARGLDLQIAAYDPFVPEAVFRDAGVVRHESLAALLRASEILSLHCPLTPETRGLLNAETIALLPRGAVIVNTARGGLIDEPALLDAIRSGHLAGAGLDTFAVEPPPKDHPFFAEPAILLTPHVAGVTREASARVGLEAVQGIVDFLAGRPLPPERVANRSLLAAAGKLPSSSGA